MINFFQKNKGSILIEVLVFGSIALFLISGLIKWGSFNLKLSKQDVNREMAFQIAEAGTEYYRWHLSHADGDFQDGTGQPGPYVHNYYDKNGNVVGTFTLEITPPQVGSWKTIVRSTGRVVADTSVVRKVEVELMKSSLTKYSIVAESDLRIGEGTEVFGPLHSNGGIRFDGLAHNLISSALSTYDDPDHSGDNEFAVHTHISPVDPYPPATVPARSDIFMAGRRFPVPAVDFDKFTNELSKLRDDAIASGIYFDNSGELGYHIVLKTDDSFDIYKVTSTVDLPDGCTQEGGQFRWGSWSIATETFLANYSFPANGLIFVEDNVWVNGQIDGAGITIGSGHFPENYGRETHIIVNEDLRYTHYDGTDLVGLIGQGNIDVGMVSANDLRIDAALIAKNDRVGRYYYEPSCSPYDIRNSITLYGSIATKERYGFAYTDGTGYQIRNIIYDANLLFNPPPSFPLATDKYEVVLWKEIK